MAEQGRRQQAGSEQSRAGAAQSETGGLSRQRATSPLTSPYELFTASPFQLMRRMMDDMDRIAESFSSSLPSLRSASTWAPPIEISRRNGTLVVTAELPGLDKEDVKVELTSEGLLIEGERREGHEGRQEGILRSERCYGRFSRLIPLSEEAALDQANAQFNNGVLEVTIPVSEEKSRRRQIPIQGGAGPTSRTSRSSGPEGRESGKQAAGL
jgi:HSP20 family protein